MLEAERLFEYTESHDKKERVTMGIFDHYTSSATATYDLEDGTHVEFGLEEDPTPPEIGEYRLLTSDDKDIAVGTWGRYQEDFLLGDENLYNLYHQWEEFEQYDTEDDVIEDGIEKPEEPKPRRCSSKGYSQGDEIYVYIPSDSTQSQQDDEYTTQLLANYVWGDVYVIEVTYPDGTVKISEEIEHADDENKIAMIAAGYGDNDDVRKLLDEVEWRENY